MSNALANPLLDDDSGLGNGLTAPAGNPRHFYQTGEDGNWYNDSGDRVYYWVPPSETDSTIRSGGETQGIGEDLGGYYTEAEIAQAYNADEGMGYLTKNVSWDNYWGFISERQGEIQAGTLVDPIQGEFARIANEQARANTDPDAIEGGSFNRQEEKYYAQLNNNTLAAQTEQMGAWVSQNSSLMDKYGIETAFTNNDGDYFVFNGSSYTRAFKVDDGSGLYSDYLGVVGEALKSWMMTGGISALAGGALGALGAGAGQIANAVGYTKNWEGFIRSIPNLPAGIQNILINAGNSIGSGVTTAGGVAGIGATGAAGASAATQAAVAAAQAASASNVIYNLNNTTPNKPYQGDGQGVDPDGNVVWNTRNLPSIYSIINGNIVHTESGTVMAEGNYSASRTQYVSFPPYTDGTKGAGGGATTSAASSSTSSTASNTSSATNGTNGEGGNKSPEHWKIEPNGDVYVISAYDPDGNKSGDWDEDGVWQGEWKKVGNTNDTIASSSVLGGVPWWIGKGPGVYGQHGETVITSESNSGSGNSAPIPKPGDACELADGTNGTFDDNMNCQSGASTTPPTVVAPTTTSTSTTSSTAPATTTSSTTSSSPSSTATNSTSTTATNTTTSTSPSSTATTAATTAGVFTVGASTWPTSSTTNTQGSNGGGSSGNNGNGSNGNNGDGDNGDGGEGNNNGGDSKGNGELPQTRGSWTNRWTPLYEETKFRRFNKDRDGKSMAVPYQQNANLAAPDLTGQRMALFSDLAKGLS